LTTRNNPKKSGIARNKKGRGLCKGLYREILETQIANAKTEEDRAYFQAQLDEYLKGAKQ